MYKHGKWTISEFCTNATGMESLMNVLKWYAERPKWVCVVRLNVRSKLPATLGQRVHRAAVYRKG